MMAHWSLLGMSLYTRKYALVTNYDIILATIYIESNSVEVWFSSQGVLTLCTQDAIKTYQLDFVFNPTLSRWGEGCHNDPPLAKSALFFRDCILSDPSWLTIPIYPYIMG